MSQYSIYGGMTPIQDALRKGWTPERIEGRLAVGFPDDPRMRVSHECLYQWIYAKPQRILDLRQYLPRGKRRRTRAKGRRSKGPRIPMRVPIAKRPKRVDPRREFGHYESDTAVGSAPSRRCIDTQVERKSRRLFARFIPDKGAPATARAGRSHRIRVFCQVGVGRFGVSFSPCERRVSGRFGVGRSCWLLVIALVIA